METAPQRERDELFVSLLAQSEAALRNFLRTLLPRWEDLDEVLQETSLVLWRKFDSFEPGSDFKRWAFMVARFEALRYRRDKARDRHVFDPELLDLLADDATEEIGTLESERRALEGCLQKLGSNERQWVHSVYGGNLKIREVAALSGRTPGSLYKALNRIRLNLMDCVTRSLGEIEPA
jgi:RNA polymerase sigma-70 factor (ECF subfamily)